MDKLNDLLAEYWDAARAEGADGRDHDTVDARAQRALSALQEHYAAIRARTVRLEEALKEISTLYWVDAPAPEEMRRIARRALEEK